MAARASDAKHVVNARHAKTFILTITASEDHVGKHTESSLFPRQA